MQLTNYSSDSQLRVSFSQDNKKMIVEGKNHEKNEIKFKDLRPVSEEEPVKEPKLHRNYTRINVINDKDGKEYRVTVKTKEFAETMDHFEGAKAKGAEKEKKLSSKEKKVISGYQELGKMEDNISGHTQEMRRNASPEQVKRFDEIDAQIKEAAKKLAIEENNPAKEKADPSQKVKSKGVEKKEKVSSKHEKKIEDYQKLGEQKKFFDGKVQEVGSKIEPNRLKELDALIKSEMGKEKPEKLQKKAPSEHKIKDSQNFLEKKISKMREKATPENLKKFDEADALVKNMMNDTNIDAQIEEIKKKMEKKESKKAEMGPSKSVKVKDIEKPKETQKKEKMHSSQADLLSPEFKKGLEVHSNELNKKIKGLESEMTPNDLKVANEYLAKIQAEKKQRKMKKDNKVG